eukprot:9486796-Pyramimonas_sp.AAC.1
MSPMCRSSQSRESYDGITASSPRVGDTCSPRCAISPSGAVTREKFSPDDMVSASWSSLEGCSEAFVRSSRGT